VDKNGNLYIACGQIVIIDPEGKRIGTIRVPERPSTLQFGGKDDEILFITARSSLYGIRILQ
jgi:sugar lactone lactonase YvrE